MVKLSGDQYKALIELIESTIDKKLDEKFDEKLKYLPSKDEFYEQTSKILKKLEDIEVSNNLLNSRVVKNTDKIGKLKKIHPKYSHTSASS